ncbi:MAG: hypothetical protein ACTSV3_06915 [Candidatus Thorarchaeota archaeon]|nr:MAG: hypothetical protein DRP09_01275 [Candidatus Thorarchaeota archaeon]RLI59179.1 MAG: hypothetical protein DRO87_03725 [Candidatus Thorarchaeota archaeon]
MRRYVVVLDNIVIDKASVKSGQNSEQTVMMCRCVNVGLFVSGDLRRDVIVSFLRRDDGLVTMISFPGASLKRVSPDERSISFFLLKAIDTVMETEKGETRVLDNGIVVERTTLETLLERWGTDTLYITREEVDSWPDFRGGHLEGTFLYAPDMELKNAMGLPSRTSPARFILELNVLSDRAAECQ